MTVIKVIEIMSNSKDSWQDAASEGIKKASKTIKEIKSAFVQNQSAVVENGEIVEYRVNLKISFEVS